MRVIGLDLGSKRIGVAVSDTSATIATPLTVIQRSKKHSIDHQAIASLVREEEAEAVVVGLPLSMSGEMGPAARAAVAESEVLATVVSVPVHLHDERLTTVAADAVLIEAKMKAQARRRVVDKVAAAVMLQSWLDARKNAQGSDHSSGAN
ncbi:MAG: Holliday junction resolvase RuvX [Ilumatobacteraceae bacterium]|jgi:putative Holliday junction resolvase|nr:Holliday junction resolvase RuvX [Ilumatobacteraceae bacterium]